MRFHEVTTQEELLARSLFQERLIAWVSSAFGLALGLAAIGMYGVVAQIVLRRTREIGVRLALGEPRSAVFKRVLADVLRIVALGTALGLPVAFAVARLLRGLLPQLESGGRSLRRCATSRQIRV